MFETLAAVATLSPKGEAGNQDRVRAFRVADPAGAGVVVCDGVGGRPASAPVAERIATLAAAHLVDNGIGKGLWDLERAVGEAPRPGEDGATTMIVIGAEATGLVCHAFVGNGSLLEIDPIEPRPGVTLLRWTDLVLPQLSWEGGRPALRSFLPPPGADFEVAKGYRVADAGRPRLYLACSDGVTTEEDRARAHGPEDSLWREVPRALTAILAVFTDAWPALLAPGEAAAELLQDTVELALARVRDEQGLDDDASIGVVLLRPREPAR